MRGGRRRHVRVKLPAMAKAARRRPGNAPGPWFVDDTCIDCDTCRQVAPDVFADLGGQSAVRHQPASPGESRAAARALLACPTGSIGTTAALPDPALLYPLELDDGVFYCGYNARDSFGASAFFARRAGGNLLIDSPRFTAHLRRALEDAGGVADVLLTHRDDVADAARWAAHFGARVWIHEDDADAAPFATDLVRGLEPAELRPNLRAVPVPGHTRGSVVFHLDDRFLFTGDSLHFSRQRRELSAFRDACWYSWREQAGSLERLLPLPFEWVLPGHGDRHHAPAGWMRSSLRRLVDRMRGGGPWQDAW